MIMVKSGTSRLHIVRNGQWVAPPDHKEQIRMAKEYNFRRTGRDQKKDSAADRQRQQAILDANEAKHAAEYEEYLKATKH